MNKHIRTKRVNTATSWLEKIEDLTVEEAIEYLKTLPQHMRLVVEMEGGDTHGVWINSWLYHEVPMTEAEIFDERMRGLVTKKKEAEYILERHHKNGYSSDQILWAESRVKDAQAAIDLLNEQRK